MITQIELMSVARYDATTGVFTRLTSAGGFHVGTEMGKTDTYGYRQLTINGRSYLAHRMAWLYVNGEWPKGQIDHIDGNNQNNHPDNLRVFASNAEHLRVTLAGKVPKWTEQGFASMCAPRGKRQSHNPMP